MEEEELKADDSNGASAEVGSTMKPSPSSLMLAAGLATAQTTLRDRISGTESDAEHHHAPSTELQAG